MKRFASVTGNWSRQPARAFFLPAEHISFDSHVNTDAHRMTMNEPGRSYKASINKHVITLMIRPIHIIFDISSYGAPPFSPYSPYRTPCHICSITEFEGSLQWWITLFPTSIILEQDCLGFCTVHSNRRRLCQTFVEIPTDQHISHNHRNR